MFMRFGNILVNTRHILYVAYDETYEGGALIIRLHTGEPDESLVHRCDLAEARAICEDLGKLAG